MWDRDPQPNTQHSLLAAASSGEEVWAGVVAGGSTPCSRAHSWHRALLRGSCPLTAALMPGGRERFMLSLRRGMLTSLASWPHGTPLYKVCPCLPSPGMAVFQRFEHFCSGGWEELPAPLQMLGTCPQPR